MWLHEEEVVHQGGAQAHGHQMGPPFQHVAQREHGAALQHPRAQQLHGVARPPHLQPSE